MSEVTFIRLTKNGDFDGTTVITLTRDKFTTVNQRLYTGAIPDATAAGIIKANIFDLFSSESPKLVGFAFSGNNPRSMVRVLDASDRVRQEINLRTDFQYAVVQSQDKIAVLSKESTVAGEAPVELMLAVNEMNERDMVAWAASHPPQDVHTHFRIIRRGANFLVNAGGAGWQPTWVWNPNSQLLEVENNTDNGPIPLTSLGLFPRLYGAFVSLRYSGSTGNGKLTVVENTTKATWEAQTTMVDGVWSKVQYLSHEDLLGLTATASAGVLVAEIEVVRVEPADRLRARYAAGG